MVTLTPDARATVADLARRHGVSTAAAEAVLDALVAGGGAMAQFNHPDLGGLGQWSRGGMVMVGDMFNHGLKQRVDALCSALADELPRLTAGASPTGGSPSAGGSSSTGGGGAWWPADLGSPASSGAQNDYRYAYFPGTRRLAIQQGGRLELYDTGDHRISGVSQQQGSGPQSATFSSDQGEVRLTDLRRVETGSAPPATPDHPPSAQSQQQPHAHARSQAHAPAEPSRSTDGHPAGDPFASIERLADLRQKGVLTDEEFAAKKAELLGRI